MPLLPVEIPPGIFKNSTQYQAKNRWFDCNLIRFTEGRIKPIGGWSRLTDDQFTNPVRGMHSWRTSAGNQYLVIGTSKSVHLYDGATIHDITPTARADGASMTAFSALTDFDVPGLGYGTDDYGEDYWGTPRSNANANLEASVWHFDNLGDTLIGVLTTDGTLWKWPGTFSGSPSAADIMVQVEDSSGSNDQVDNIGVIVTPERHVLTIGPGGNPRKVAFSSQGTLTEWTASATNTAGNIELQTRGKLVTARRTRYGVLLFTTSDIYRLNYLGPPLVYSVERIAESAGPSGANAVAGSADLVAWMSSQGRFFYYDGYVRPLSCDVADHVFTDINLEVAGLVAAGHNSKHSEIWWFYPTSGGTVPTRYVAWNYRDKTWVIGELHRSFWHDSAALGLQIAAGNYDSDNTTGGYLYRMEEDADDTRPSRDATISAPSNIQQLSENVRVLSFGQESSDGFNPCFAETGAVELREGNKNLMVNQIVTDTDSGTNGLQFSIRTQFTPDGTSTTHGPFPLQSDGYTDARFSGREGIMKIQSGFDQEWRFGTVRFNARLTGNR